MVLFTILLLPLLFYTVLCDDKVDAVREYTDEDFTTNMEEHKTALVMFYAPWCGHCKNLKPEFAKAAKELAQNDPPIALVRVDCTEDGKETCDSFKVSGYPTLKIFRDGKLSKEYAGPRHASGIVEYMIRQAAPCSSEIKEQFDLDAYLDSKTKVSVVGFFKEETELKRAFLETAEEMRESAQFAHTSIQNFLEKFDVSDDIILFRPIQMRNKFEDHQVEYSGNATMKDIKEFILNNYHGLVGHRVSTNREEFKSPIVIAYYQIDYIKNPKGTNYWRNRILKVAKDYKDKLTFAISPKEDLNEFDDATDEDEPIIFANDADGKKYKMEDEFSVETLQKFVENFLENKLEVYVKSEPIPEDNDGPVLVAVAKNFDEMVINNGKDTLLMFHSPWCAHCKKLMPVYEELAEELQEENIAIVKMDGTKNEVPAQFTLDGYPSIFWLPKDEKDKPIKYEGERQLKDFIKYISEHATDELDGYDRTGKSKEKGKDEL